MDDLTRDRIVQNEATFRAANEQIREAAERIGADQNVPFICECADVSCSQVLLIDLTRYAEIRGDPRRYIHAVGHAAPAGMIVERCAGYEIVVNDE